MNIIKLEYNGIVKNITIAPGNIVSIGRDKESNTISINNPIISRTHLKIENDGKNIYVTDLGSTNGTFISGNKLEKGHKYLVNFSDKINIPKTGNACIISLCDIKNDISNNQSTIKEVGGSTFLSSNKGDQHLGIAALLKHKDEIIIGRSKECDIVVNDNAVSRKHLKVFKSKEEFYIEDLGSTNGTFINQKRIKSITKFNTWDILYVGLHAFSLNSVSLDLTKENAIQAIHIKKIYKNGNIGLQPISLTIQAKNMVALMGPSGCGKSTLLKVLNGDTLATSGRVYIYGLELTQNYELLKQKIGYVPQDDIVHLELTVNDTLYYAAKLRLADDALETLIQERISEVLSSLNLNDPLIRNTKVKDLSGGQRKRISIAVELLNKPSILFLDEPTSSLDPETIEDFLKCLRNLCENGTTVIMVTHKPEDLYYMNEIVFFGIKGYHVFHGPRDNFLPYFQKKNIVEVYSLLNSEIVAREWNRKLNKSSQNLEVTKVTSIKKNNNISPIRQLFWISKRYLDIKLSNRKNMALLFLQPLLIAILLKLAFPHLVSENFGVKIGSVSAIFMMTIAAIWFGVSNSAKEIVGEKPIFRRERMYNLSIGNYFLSKWIVLSLISFFQLLVFLLIIQFLYGNELNNFSHSFVFLFFISISSILFGLLLSALSKSTEEVMTILPIALLAQIILAGVISPLQNKVTEFFSYFTFGRWGTEGLARLQDVGNTAFMSGLNLNLYNDKLSGIFNSFSNNVIVIIILDIIFIFGVISALNRMEKKT